MISGIRCIDLIPVLSSHSSEDIYLRTDQYWTSLGAYYAAKYLSETIDVPFTELSDYTEYINEGYVGELYDITQSSELFNDPENFVYYVPSNEYTADYYDAAFNYAYSSDLFEDVGPEENFYNTFLGGSDHIVKISTDIENGRRLLIIKDSFGNCIIPFLTGSFEKIYVVDQRFFDINLIKFIKYSHITDVLFANSYSALSGPQADLLEYITYSNYDEDISDNAP